MVGLRERFYQGNKLKSYEISLIKSEIEFKTVTVIFVTHQKYFSEREE